MSHPLPTQVLRARIRLLLPRSICLNEHEKTTLLHSLPFFSQQQLAQLWQTLLSEQELLKRPKTNG